MCIYCGVIRCICNPFSVENMKIALDSLRVYAGEIENDESADEGLKRSLSSVESIEISTTDLYVLCVYSIDGFKDNLLAIYPSKSALITQFVDHAVNTAK